MVLPRSLVEKCHQTNAFEGSRAQKHVNYVPFLKTLVNYVTFEARAFQSIVNYVLLERAAHQSQVETARPVLETQNAKIRRKASKTRGF